MRKGSRLAALGIALAVGSLVGCSPDSGSTSSQSIEYAVSAEPDFKTLWTKSPVHPDTDGNLDVYLRVAPENTPPARFDLLVTVDDRPVAASIHGTKVLREPSTVLHIVVRHLAKSAGIVRFNVLYQTQLDDLASDPVMSIPVPLRAESAKVAPACPKAVIVADKSPRQGGISRSKGSISFPVSRPNSDLRLVEYRADNGRIRDTRCVDIPQGSNGIVTFETGSFGPGDFVLVHPIEWGNPPDITALSGVGYKYEDIPAK